MIAVMKFGGAALADASAIRTSVSIIASYLQRGDRVLAVVSALPGVTDRLLGASAIAVEGNFESINRFIEEITKLHANILEQSIRNPRRKDESIHILQQTATELSGVLRSIALLKEITPRSRDFILSFGERFSAPIFCASANEAGLPAEWLTGGAAGIVTNEDFGEASPLVQVTAHRARDRLLPSLNAGKLLIVAGYGAESTNGITTTLGRGGSDYSATLLGSVLDADETIIWKEVDGLMTADPKIVPEARLLTTVSYAEACEMAYFGAKVIHPRALEPAIEKQMPVRVRNAFNLRNQGTLIGASESRAGAVKAITLIDKVGMVTVTNAGMTGLVGAAARVFKVLGEAKTNILMISQSSSEQGISFVVPRPKLDETIAALERSLLGGLVSKVAAESDVCVVAAVGSGMKGTPGVATKLLKAVADEGINVRMIAQGSSELNISFVVAERDGLRAVRAIHRTFELDRL